jgi:hypothetical protein
LNPVRHALLVALDPANLKKGGFGELSVRASSQALG